MQWGMTFQIAYSDMPPIVSVPDNRIKSSSNLFCRHITRLKLKTRRGVGGLATLQDSNNWMYKGIIRNNVQSNKEQILIL